MLEIFVILHYSIQKEIIFFVKKIFFQNQKTNKPSISGDEVDFNDTDNFLFINLAQGTQSFGACALYGLCRKIARWNKY